MEEQGSAGTLNGLPLPLANRWEPTIQSAQVEVGHLTAATKIVFGRTMGRYTTFQGPMPGPYFRPTQP